MLSTLALLAATAAVASANSLYYYEGASSCSGTPSVSARGPLRGMCVIPTQALGFVGSAAAASPARPPCPLTYSVIIVWAKQGRRQGRVPGVGVFTYRMAMCGACGQSAARWAPPPVLFWAPAPLSPLLSHVSVHARAASEILPPPLPPGL